MYYYYCYYYYHYNYCYYYYYYFQSIGGFELFTDLPGFKNPSIITSGTYRPDFLLVFPNNSLLYIVELTVGHESNFHNNIIWKKHKYKELLRQQKQYFHDICLICKYLFKLSHGVFAKESDIFLEMFINTRKLWLADTGACSISQPQFQEMPWDRSLEIANVTLIYSKQTMLVW